MVSQTIHALHNNGITFSDGRKQRLKFRCVKIYSFIVIVFDFSTSPMNSLL